MHLHAPLIVGSEVDGYLVLETLPRKPGEIPVELLRGEDTTTGDGALLVDLSKLRRSADIQPLYDSGLQAAQVEHSHLLELLASSSPEREHCYLCWSLPPGETLRARLGRSIPDLRASVRIVLGAAEGLGALHGAGLYSGNVNPATVFLDTEGNSYSIAPGLSSASIDPETDPRGAAYRAPEQLPGGKGPIGPTTDVYSLGVLLFELLEGELPFAAPSLDSLRGQMEGAPSPTLIGMPGYLPHEIEDLIEGTLAPEPSGRFGDASAVARRLRTVAELLDPTPSPRPASRIVTTTTATATLAVEQGPPSQGQVPRRPSGLDWPGKSWVAEERERLAEDGVSLWRLWLAPLSLLLLLAAAAIYWFW